MKPKTRGKRMMSLLLAGSLAVGGCSNMTLTESQKSILAGTAAGAATGAAAGAIGGDAALGAAAGAGAGLLGGLIYNLLRRGEAY